MAQMNMNEAGPRSSREEREREIAEIDEGREAEEQSSSQMPQ